MSAAAKAQVAAGAARLTALWARDRLTRARPVMPGEVPPTVDLLTTGWLSGVLCSAAPGAAVTSFELGHGTAGTSHRHSLRVSYNEAGTAAGLPTALFTKSTPTLATRLLYGLNSFGEQEAAFYTRIRSTLDVEVPMAYYAVCDPRSAASLIILDDLVATRGARFGDPLSSSYSRAEAEALVEVMASYHGAFWANERLERERWILDETEWQRRVTEGFGYRRVFETGVKRSREIMPRSIVARETKLWQALLNSVDLCAVEPPTLLHRDPHSRNSYLTADGKTGLYDWQMVGKGSWALDLSYALAVGLQTEDRRAWERDLVELYLDRVAAAGGQPPQFDQAWTSYRQQLMHGIAFWLATIALVGRKLQPETQPLEICVAAVSRLTQAAEDLQTLDALGIN